MRGDESDKRRDKSRKVRLGMNEIVKSKMLEMELVEAIKMI